MKTFVFLSIRSNSVYNLKVMPIFNISFHKEQGIHASLCIFCLKPRLVLVSFPAAIDAAFIGFLAQDSCRLSDVTLNSHYLLEIISRLSLGGPLLASRPMQVQ